MALVEEILIWLASGACALGVVCQFILVVRQRDFDLPPLFVVLYFSGITAWFGFGLDLKSLALTLTCGLQIPIMIYLLWRLTQTKLGERAHGT